MVQAERLDFNDDLTWRRLRLRNLTDDKLFRAAILLDDDCFHGFS
jgi:hypothetical protein